MKKIISSLIIIFAVTTIASVCLAASTGTTTADNLRLRSKASTNSEAIDVLNNGTKVNIISTEGNFYKVSVGNQTGYLSKDYVKTNDSSNSSNSNSTTKSSENNTTSKNEKSDINKTENTSGEETIDNTSSEEKDDTSSNETLTSSETTVIDSWDEESINKANTTNLTNDATLYVLPLLNSTKLGELSSGTEVMIISINGKWAYIQTDTKSGWVSKSLLKKQTVTVPQGSKVTETTSKDDNSLKDSSQSKETNTGKTMYVNSSNVRVRSEASTSGSIVETLSKGSKVTVTSDDSDWYKVTTSSGKEGFILGKYLSENK